MMKKADVFMTRGMNRTAAVQSVPGTLDLSVFSGSSAAIRANYNSQDPFPASTHIDALDTLFSAVLEQRPARVTLAERSGMGNTRGSGGYRCYCPLRRPRF